MQHLVGQQTSLQVFKSIFCQHPTRKGSLITCSAAFTDFTAHYAAADTLTVRSYTGKPKYRCPRCKTQTCSLPCYKRHQQRASCNGQRDPAAYVKKSAWATPSGIDHDYNYLKSVERSVDRAGQDLAERGVGRRHQASTSDKRVARAQAPGSALYAYLEKHDVRVERAPVGMSRQRANRTRTTNRGKVMWTVEWIDSLGEKTLNHDNEGARLVSELWKETMSIKRNAEHSVKRDRKRKKGLSGDGQKNEPEPGSQHEEPPAKLNRAVPSGDDRPNLSEVKSLPDGRVECLHQVNEGKDGENTSVSEDSKERKDRGKNVDSVKPMVNQSTTDIPIPHFYLLMPFTASKAKVVVPLESASSLTECLAHRTVLEYPTVFILDHQPDALPDGYLLHDTYEKEQRREQKEVDGLLEEAQRSGADPSLASGQDEKPLDAGSILDMLQRDVGL